MSLGRVLGADWPRERNVCGLAGAGCAPMLLSYNPPDRSLMKHVARQEVSLGRHCTISQPYRPTGRCRDGYAHQQLQ